MKTAAAMLGAATALAALAACITGTSDRSTPATTAVDAGTAPDVGVALDAGTLDADGGVCLGTPLHLYEESKGVLESVYVDLAVDGTTMPFQLDTGSAYSFRSSPGADGGAAFATKTTLSCVEVSLPGYPGVFWTTPDGLSVGGLLGSDLVSRGVTLDVRLAEGMLRWSNTPEPTAPGAIVLPVTFHVSADPYAANTITVSRVRLDGMNSDLLLDTGSPHMVILSSTPRPGETKFEVQDGNGNPVTLYGSTIDISFEDGTHRTVAVDRAESFPSLEQTFRAIGFEADVGDGRVRGILGLNALGRERIVLSKTSLSFVPPPP